MSETGHARNIEKFQQLISFVEGYGATYNPSNANIAVAALQAKLTEAEGGIDEVTTALAPSKAAINARQTAFANLRPLTTKVVNFYASYFAGAFILPKALITQKLKLLFDKKTFDTSLFEKTMQSFNASPESFYQRLTNILPKE